ncbi:hypothetical protein VPUCM_1231 [Vibrio parahaemolyticus UCM-V493]|nr:hypothetical protein VPUCM_1231 [Vibrio parahaemolyticus UCM-V493]
MQYIFYLRPWIYRTFPQALNKADFEGSIYCFQKAMLEQNLLPHH